MPCCCWSSGWSCARCPPETVDAAGLDGPHRLVAIVGALVLDVTVLGAMIPRIGELGFTPNRTAALG